MIWQRVRLNRSAPSAQEGRIHTVSRGSQQQRAFGVFGAENLSHPWCDNKLSNIRRRGLIDWTCRR
jgi:hypothetical protein